MLPNEVGSPRRRPVKSVLRYVMAAFYVWAGVNHFARPDFYLNLMPAYIPLHTELVYLSGIVEIVLGVLVAIPRTAALAAWGIILMLIAFLPVHVHMLVNNHLYPEAPTSVLWLRFPIQALFILWAYWYTGRSERGRTTDSATAAAA
jgi:uncharacterized membrane protein